MAPANDAGEIAKEEVDAVFAAALAAAPLREVPPPPSFIRQTLDETKEEEDKEEEGKEEESFWSACVCVCVSFSFSLFSLLLQKRQRRRSESSENSARF